MPDAVRSDALNASTVPKFLSPLFVLPAFEDEQVDVGGGKRANYVVHMEQFEQQILPAGFPATTVWGYCGRTTDGRYVQHSPGPVMDAHVDKSTTVLFINDLTGPHILPVDPTLMFANPNNMSMPLPPFLPWPPGYALAQQNVAVVPHMHGAESAPLMDGNPGAWWTASGVRGPWYHSLVPTTRNASVMLQHNRQVRGWRWFHDHAVGITRLNVYAGLASFFYLHDDSDPLERLLPRGRYQVPLMLRDALFTSDGQLWLSATGDHGHAYWTPETVGDVILVNGVAWPNLDVDRGVYRFVFLDAADARFFQLSLSDGSAMTLLSSGQSFLPSAQRVPELLLAPSMRAEVLIDFSAYAPGTQVWLLNSANAPYPGGAPVTNNTRWVMQFTVTARAGHRMSAPLPEPLTRVETLARTGSNIGARMSVLQDHPSGLSLDLLNFEFPAIDFPRLGDTELWQFVNPTPDAHPIHLHLVAFQLHARQFFNATQFGAVYNGLNGVDFRETPPSSVPVAPFLLGEPQPVAAAERGWQDVFIVNPEEVVTVAVRWASTSKRPFPFAATGLPGYLFHCHMLSHEDSCMMRPFVIVQPS